MEVLLLEPPATPARSGCRTSEEPADITVGATRGGLFGACEMDNIPWLLGNLTAAC